MSSQHSVPVPLALFASSLMNGEGTPYSVRSLSAGTIISEVSPPNRVVRTVMVSPAAWNVTPLMGGPPEPAPAGPLALNRVSYELAMVCAVTDARPGVTAMMRSLQSRSEQNRRGAGRYTPRIRVLNH